MRATGLAVVEPAFPVAWLLLGPACYEPVGTSPQTMVCRRSRVDGSVVSFRARPVKLRAVLVAVENWRLILVLLELDA